MVTGNRPQEKVAAILPCAPDVRVPPILRIAQNHQRHLTDPILRKDIAMSESQRDHQQKRATHGVNLDHEKGPQ